MAKNGRDVVMEAKGGNSDEFGKGIVGKPSEVEGEQSEEQQLVYGGGLFRKESAGVEYGLSDHETLDPDTSEPDYNYAVDPMTGNAPERKVGRANNSTVKGKRGSFDIGEN